MINPNKFSLEPKLPTFPQTRYQGSKRKVLGELSSLLSTIPCTNILDLYSGSGIVTLLFRYLGKDVYSNDFLTYNENTASVFLKSDFSLLNIEKLSKELKYLIYESDLNESPKVEKNYEGIYFLNSENLEIDRFVQNVKKSENSELFIYAVGQALLKKRPYNLFHRANLNMRTKDVKRSFGNAKTWESSILEHSMKCIKELKKMGRLPSVNFQTFSINTNDLSPFDIEPDVIYMDPPYVNNKGVGVDYSNFYNFLEGLLNYELYDQYNDMYPHKPIVKKDSCWLKESGCFEEIDRICERWQNSTIIMSYRNDGRPTPEDIKSRFEFFGRRTEIHSVGSYQYSLSKNKLSEELFIISKTI